MSAVAMRRGVRMLVAAVLAAAIPAAAAQAPADDALQATVAGLDLALFDSFNRCADPVQLQRHAAFFDAAVEFYHDTGGVTFDRDSMLANTRAHACGRYTRALVPGSLQVHPLPGYGALATGLHRFCAAGSERCDGEAAFAIIWRQRDGHWQVTRVLSYGHHAVAR